MPEQMILKLPSFRARYDYICKNPAVASQVFINMVVNAFFKILIGLPLEEYTGRRTGRLHFDKDHKGGIFGKINECMNL